MAEIADQANSFRLAFEKAKDAIFWADAASGKIINCNKAAEALLEQKREEIIGQPQTSLHPKDKADLYVKKFKQHIAQQGAVDAEAEVITRSGKIIPVRISASIIDLGNKTIIQGIFQDITKQKQAEKDHNKRYQELEKMNKYMIGRELDMIELKREVNALLKGSGQAPKYRI